MEKQLKMLESYCDFSNPAAVYVLILLPRKKENAEQTERAKLQKRSRYIVSNMDEVKFALEDFDRYTKMYPEVVFRIYVSVNRRSLSKALYEYKKVIAELDYNIGNGNMQAWTPIKKLGSEFKSVLARKESKFDKLWMFDCDFPNNTPEGNEIFETFKKHLDEITEVKYSGKTKSGYSIVVRGCNPKDLVMPKDTEVKKDDYLYVDVINDPDVNSNEYSKAEG